MRYATAAAFRIALETRLKTQARDAGSAGWLWPGDGFSQSATLGSDWSALKMGPGDPQVDRDGRRMNGREREAEAGG